MLDGKKLVLVIVTAFDFGDLIKEKLEARGHTVVLAENLEDVWRVINSLSGGLSVVDLLILDGFSSRDYIRRDGSKLYSPGNDLACTLEFINDLRAEGYEKPILANSGSGLRNCEMIKAGASHNIDEMGRPTHPWIVAERILRG